MVQIRVNRLQNVRGNMTMKMFAQLFLAFADCERHMTNVWPVPELKNNVHFLDVISGIDSKAR